MILFLFGPDTYRSREKLREVVEEYKKRHQSGLNFIKMDFIEKDMDDFKQAVETVSMFDEKKLVVMEGIFEKSKSFQEELQDYLKEKKITNNKDLIVVFWTEKVDSKNKLFQFLKRKAKAQEFKLLQPHKLGGWIGKYIKEQGRNIESQATEKLINCVGNDLWRMSNELDKLISFKKGTIEERDIEKLVKPEIDVNIFNTIDALGQKNKKRALKLVHDHFKKGESEGYLLNRFAYQFRNLLKIKDLLDRGTPVNLLAKKADLHPFVAQKTSQQARNFSFEDLKKIYRKLLAIDLDIKTGKIDAKTALEMFVASL